MIATNSTNSSGATAAACSYNDTVTRIKRINIWKYNTAGVVICSNTIYSRNTNSKSTTKPRYRI